MSDNVELFEAAERNDTETVKFLAEKKGALLSAINDVDQTVAHIAVKNDNLDLVKYILEKDSSIFKDTEHSYTLLQLAVQNNALHIVKYLVEKHGAVIVSEDYEPHRTTALHAAVKSGHLNVLKYFVEERNADVNTVDWQDTPVVFFAVKYQHGDIVKYLVEEKSANLTMLDRYEENILFITVRTDDLISMKYLLDERKANLDINWRNYGGETLVHKAVVYNRFNMLEYLVGEKHADVNIPDKWHFMTPLHYAASRNRYEFCKYLVDHGADTLFQDDSGQIPMQKASEKHLVDYMKKVSIRRSRRSLDLLDYVRYQPITTFRDFEELPVKYRGHLSRATAGHAGTDGTSISSTDFFSSHHFPTFLAIAEMIITRANVSKRHQSFLSTPQTILQNKMDLSVLEAVEHVPNFY